MTRLFARILLLSVFASAALAQEKPISISGIVFGDYYMWASSHDESLEGKNGFLMRRGYLTIDKSFGDDLFARFRLEANQPGDYRTNATMETYVKDAFLRWNYSPRHQLIAGLQPSATWDTAERLWGYRPVERTATEVFRLGSSRDLGIAATGAIGAKSRYHVMIGNGSGTGSEVDTGKKISAAYTYSPTKEMTLEVYADAEDGDRSTYTAFAGYTREAWRVGLQLAHQDRGDLGLDVASLYGVMDVRKDVTILGRIDRMFDPNPEASRVTYLPMDPTSEATLFILGVDYQAHKNISLIPNVEIVTYDDEGIGEDILGRLTLVFTF